MVAVKTTRARLAAGDTEGETSRSLAEAMLLRASSDYIEQAERFTADDHRVAEHFHLQALVSADYWASLTDGTASTGNRQGELVSIYSRLMFASSHLPRLLSLISDAGTTAGQFVVSNSGSFVLELADLRVAGNDSNVESAADPDRIARVIDGANMIYQGAALLAGGSPASLKLASISGNENRTLVFHGQQETATAVRRIIRHLSAISTTTENLQDGSDEAINVEYLVEQLPFLASLSELERIGALSGERTGDIRSSVLAGSIMLVEAGVVLTERDRDRPVDELVTAAGAVSDTASSPVSITVETEVEAHYLDHFDAVRERMLGEYSEPAVDALPDVTDEHSQKTTTLPGAEPSDDLDDLIVDLNRLYKR